MNLKLSRALRIAILECDNPLPKTKEKFQGYGGVFKFLLQSGAKALGRPDLDPEGGLEFSFWQIESNPDKYPDPKDIDAILITGSSEYFLCRFARLCRTQRFCRIGLLVSMAGINARAMC